MYPNPCCINHIFPPKNIDKTDKSAKPDHGDCRMCQPDPENNPKCSGFQPSPKIHFYNVTIISKEEDKWDLS